jgi:hypothetical protein
VFWFFVVVVCWLLFVCVFVGWVVCVGVVCVFGVFFCVGFGGGCVVFGGLLVCVCVWFVWLVFVFVFGCWVWFLFLLWLWGGLFWGVCLLFGCFWVLLLVGFFMDVWMAPQCGSAGRAG